MKNLSYLFLVLFILTLSGVAISATEESEVTVDIESSCDIGSDELQGPGNNEVDTNISVTGVDEVDYFDKLFYNAGNSKVNISVFLNVTKVNELWRPGEPIGNYTNLSQQNNTENLVNNTFYNSFNISSGNIGANNTYKQYVREYYTDPAYGSGTFVGRMYVNYTCETDSGIRGKDTHLYDWANFVVLDLEGSSGGVNTTGNQTAPPIPENVNRTGDEEAQIGNNTGDKPTEVTQPEDVNQTGEESDEPLEGNSSNPGETPEPTPGDSSEPGQSRKPVLQIDIEPNQNVYSATQGRFASATLNIQNVGGSEAENLNITPKINQIRDEWRSRSAEIANIGVNESVEREVFVRPPGDQNSGKYVIPVEASDGNATLDLDYFTVDVNRSEYLDRLEISEAPRSVTMSANETNSFPVLVENTGERELSGIEAEVQNFETCGIATASNIDNLDINESDSIEIEYTSYNQSQECRTTLILTSDQGTYSFTDIQFTIIPDEGLIPEDQRAPLLAIIWTLIIAIFALVRKKYQLSSGFLRIPFVMLVVGETLILMYMVINYYGVLNVPFLPF